MASSGETTSSSVDALRGLVITRSRREDAAEAKSKSKNLLEEAEKRLKEAEAYLKARIPGRRKPQHAKCVSDHRLQEAGRRRWPTRRRSRTSRCRGN